MEGNIELDYFEFLSADDIRINLTRYAELCLRALAEQGLGDVISLGG
jgi:hypothetical protein